MLPESSDDETTFWKKDPPKKYIKQIRKIAKMRKDGNIELVFK